MWPAGWGPMSGEGSKQEGNTQILCHKCPTLK